ncbi:MAG TPA: hypothetical protein VFB72_21220, partial [Verrucomicrobiae bacterium]|nr:hypothetical protein [Verrucomicrobiae bacterium]
IAVTAPAKQVLHHRGIIAECVGHLERLGLAHGAGEHDGILRKIIRDNHPIFARPPVKAWNLMEAVPKCRVAGVVRKAVSKPVFFHGLFII